MPNDQPLQAVPRRSLEHRSADALRTAIITGRYPPGSRLTEMQLSELLGTSRGTVRSALQRLATEGLVAQRPYAAWEVIGLTVEDAWELFTLRGALEGLAAELVAGGIGEHRIAPDPLRVAFDTLVKACETGDIEQADEADFNFHKTLVATAAHTRLLQQYERVEAQLRMLVVRSNEYSRVPTRLIAEHRPLLKILLAGEAEPAGAAFRAHIRKTAKAALTRLQSGSKKPGTPDKSGNSS
jgi:DNA-binding GntR family transcriptional regulator